MVLFIFVRMRNTTFFIFCLTTYTICHSQDKTVKQLQKEADKSIKKDADTAQSYWKKGGMFNLNISQGSLSNWAAGGDDFSLSLNAQMSLFGFYKKGKYSWDNTLDMNFGYMKTTTLGSRKNDDRFDLLSKYGRAISSKWNLAALFNFRSQRKTIHT